MKKNKILIGVLALSLLPKLSYAAGDIKIYIDDKEIKSDVSAVIEDGRTLVPLRMISEGLGADVNWEGATRGVEISKNNKEPLWIYCDSNIAKVNNNKIMYLEKAPKIINDRTFVPLRFIAESFDLVDKDNYKTAVLWDEGTRSVKIYSDINNTNMSEEDVFLSQLEKIQNILINMSKGLATENNEIEKTNIINKNKERIEKISSEIVVPEKHKVKYTEYKNILNQINPSNINISELNKTYEIISGKEIKIPKKAENKQIVNTKDIDVNAVKFIKNGKDITSPNKIINENGNILIPVDLLAKIRDTFSSYHKIEEGMVVLELGVYDPLFANIYIDKKMYHMPVDSFGMMTYESKFIGDIFYVPMESITHTNKYGYIIKDNIINIYNREHNNGNLKGLLEMQYELYEAYPYNDFINKLDDSLIYNVVSNMGLREKNKLDLNLKLNGGPEVDKKVGEFLKIRKEMANRQANTDILWMDGYNHSDIEQSTYAKNIVNKNLWDLPEKYKQLEKLYDEILEIYVQNGYI